MNLKDILKREFKGYKKEKLDKILEQLEDIGIITEKDICYLKEDDLNRMDLKDVELRKLLALKAEYQNGLYMTLKEIFRGEPDGKIESYLKVLLDLDINQADHLPLGLDLIDSCSEFQEIDKKKIRQYIARNYPEDFQENRKLQNRNFETEQQTKSRRHEVVMAKVNIVKTIVESKCRERQQIADHRRDLAKAKEETIKNTGWFGHMIGIGASKEKRLNEMMDSEGQRLNSLDISLQDHVQGLEAITNGYLTDNPLTASSNRLMCNSGYNEERFDAESGYKYLKDDVDDDDEDDDDEAEDEYHVDIISDNEEEEGDDDDGDDGDDDDDENDNDDEEEKDDDDCDDDDDDDDEGDDDDDEGDDDDGEDDDAVSVDSDSDSDDKSSKSSSSLT